MIMQLQKDHILTIIKSLHISPDQFEFINGIAFNALIILNMQIRNSQWD